MAMAKLKSKDPDGRHVYPLEKVKVIRHEPDATIVETAAGIRCRAQYNPFVGYYYADDVYEIVEDETRQYRYGMRNRGCSPGCQPKDGFIGREDSSRYYDEIVYSRRLTAAEIYQYELDDLN